MKQLPFRVVPVFVLITLLLVSCVGGDDDAVYAPKPRGYFRIDFPKKAYRLYDSVCPYKFEIPAYSYIDNDRHKGAEPCWLNLNFPSFHAKLHLSYKEVHNNLSTYLENSRDFAIKHQVKSTGIDETPVIRDSAKVYGLVYDIAGNTASAVQFYITDSTRHFMRGSLYFDAIPNIDSLKIVVDFLRQDVLHMIKTFQWKNEQPLKP